MLALGLRVDDHEKAANPCTLHKVVASHDHHVIEEAVARVLEVLVRDDRLFWLAMPFPQVLYLDALVPRIHALVLQQLIIPHVLAAKHDDRDSTALHHAAIDGRTDGRTRWHGEL